jgi:hypothetical protein
LYQWAAQTPSNFLGPFDQDSMSGSNGIPT